MVVVLISIMSNKKKRNHIDNRRQYDKVYGQHTNWEVLKHNLFKLIVVDMISKSFVVLCGSLIFTVWFLADQIFVTKNTVEWTELLVAITPSSFFAFYWIERKLAGEMLRLFFTSVGEFFKSRR